MKRRTQAERREQSVRRLLDATTESLIEVGYARTSAAEICQRADLSTGGLFRHFPSVEALMVAAAEDVGEKILVGYRDRFAKSGKQSLSLALQLVRETCRSRLNQAWYELAVAARTNPRLKKAIAPLAARYYGTIGQLARELMPELAEALPGQFDLLAETVVAIFDGEQVHRLLLKDNSHDEARIQLLTGLIEMLLIPRSASP